MYRISYIGDGLAGEFEFAFPFFQSADICVALDGVLATSGADFSVVPNARMNGGTVVMATPPVRGVRVDIFRRISLTRTIDYQPTDRILPEHLNADFNFLLEAVRDINTANIDIADWKNIHDSAREFLDRVTELFSDKLSPGALGVFNNLMSVLADARPYLINDYGSITDVAPNELRDDYGIL